MISLESNNKGLNRFLKDITKELKKTNTSLVLSLSQVYMDGVRVGGYFDGSSRKIVINLKEEDWVAVLVHEYCHYLQNKRKKKVWINLKNSLEYMWMWIDKEIELDKKEIKRIITSVQNMELDCERMSVKLIERYKLPIDLKEYIQTANMYLYFHNYVLKKRLWYKEEMGICSFKKLLKLMPKDLKGCRNKMPIEWYDIIDGYFC